MEIEYEYPKLDPKFKKRWIKALRSGKFKQGLGQLSIKIVQTDALQPSHEFCCLGVAGRLCGMGFKELNGMDYLSGDEVPKTITGDEKTSLKLSYMNDGNSHPIYNPKGKRHTFIEIADWIDKNL